MVTAIGIFLTIIFFVGVVVIIKIAIKQPIGSFTNKGESNEDII